MAFVTFSLWGRGRGFKQKVNLIQVTVPNTTKLKSINVMDLVSGHLLSAGSRLLTRS